MQLVIDARPFDEKFIHSMASQVINGEEALRQDCRHDPALTQYVS